LFFDRATCHACHRIGNRGGNVGPDLTKIGAIRSGRDLLESIVLPSATFTQGYETYLATLKDGGTLTGIQVRETGDELVLRDASGAEDRLAKSQITSLERMKLSLMPEGLLQALTRDEVRDLMAYLQSMK